jgi:hypothetical protein
MKTNPINWRRWAFVLALVGCLQFIVLTTVAMFYYPGGTHTNNDTVGYSFWSNFFSDLGRRAAFTGASNAVSHVLFVIALCFAAVVLALAFVAFPRLFTREKSARRLATLGSIVGIISVISYIGIAAQPYDLHQTTHKLFVYVGFTAFLVVVALFSAAIFRDKLYPNAYAFTYLGFAIILALYLVLLFAGPKAATEWGNRIQATGQKIVVYAEIVCMFIQSYGGLRVQKWLRDLGAESDAVST